MQQLDVMLAKLNTQQKQAVLDESPALLVGANVGSGKTTVLTTKIQYLHEKRNVKYEDMVVLTFTNKAAAEIRFRLGEEQIRECFGTFHSVAYYLLLTHDLDVESLGYTRDFTIIEPEEELELAKQLIKREALKIKYQNRLKKRLEQKRPDKYQDDLPRLRILLQEEKKRRNQMSFDELMQYTIMLLGMCSTQRFKPSWIIIDEVQDCDQLQLDFLAVLKTEETKLFAVGDPNQMIYSFRGNAMNVFYQLKQTYQAKEMTLSVNYRSSAAILSAAKYFQQNGAELIGVRQEGEKILLKKHYDSFQEAGYLADRIKMLHSQGIAYREIAVFYRLQAQSAVLENVFSKEEIPYHVQVRQTTDFMAKLGQNLAEFTQNRSDSQINEVQLMTLHASKGLEFSHVFMIGMNTGLIPLQNGSYGDDDEERRLFFVGMTRAKNYLELSYYTNPDQYHARPGESYFLRQFPEGILQRDEETEKPVDLQNLKRQIQQEKAQKNSLSDEKESIIKKKIVSHPKYGKGSVVAEDDSMITVCFEDYGQKEFVKIFSELTDCT